MLFCYLKVLFDYFLQNIKLATLFSECRLKEFTLLLLLIYEQSTCVAKKCFDRYVTFCKIVKERRKNYVQCQVYVFYIHRLYCNVQGLHTRVHFWMHEMAAYTMCTQTYFHPHTKKDACKFSIFEALVNPGQFYFFTFL